MRKQCLLVGILAISLPLFVSVPFAAAQSFNFGGLGNSGGLSPGAYQSLGTVSAMMGQTNIGRFGMAPLFFAGHDGEYQFSNEEEKNEFGFGYPGYFPWYYGDFYEYPYFYGRPYYGESAGQAYESELPQAHLAYLEYSVKKKSLQEEAKSGKSLAVDFKSNPSGAMVRVDGYFMGRTPTTVRIPLGKHLVTVKKWGYEWWKKELNVEGGKPLHLSAQLQLFGARGRESRSMGIRANKPTP